MNSEVTSESTNGAKIQIESYLVTDAEARAMLRLSRASLVRMRQSGRLPYVLINGRSVRYRRSDLVAFADSQLKIARPRGRARG